MISEENQNYFRCWHGYRMIFTSDISIPLDANYIPRFRYPKMSRSQLTYAGNNARNAARQVDARLFWLFCLVNNISNLGGMPHVFEDLVSDTKLDKMHKVYRQYVLEDHEASFQELKKIGDMKLQGLHSGESDLIKLLKDGEISVLAVMRYHRLISSVDITFLKEQDGILSNRLHRVLKQSFLLEKNHHITDRIWKIKQRLIEQGVS